MANPQKENGYTGIANKILEALCKYKLNGTQYSIILMVLRYTYGFSRKQHKMSIGFIANAIGKTERAVKKELKTLIEKNLLIVIKENTKTEPRILQFNKNYDTWVGNDCSREQNAPSEGNNSSPNEGNKTPPKIEIIKTNSKTNNYMSVFDYYMSLGLIKHRTFTDDMAKAIKKAITSNKYDIEYCKVLLERHKKVVELTKNTDFPVKPRGFTEFFGQKVFNATHLICSEYDEGGKYYEQYLKSPEAEKPKTPINDISNEQIAKILHERRERQNGI